MRRAPPPPPAGDQLRPPSDRDIRNPRPGHPPLPPPHKCSPFQCVQLRFLEGGARPWPGGPSGRLPSRRSRAGRWPLSGPLRRRAAGGPKGVHPTSPRAPECAGARSQDLTGRAAGRGRPLVALCRRASPLAGAPMGRPARGLVERGPARPAPP
ncbi:unnamed protein product [Danaus chrysippus]|uniref:(African queen) hypothetical protein n=1 Tax=Danaus chrysippus TaxID=151541 RepID=A0A8J2QSB6_9NEOP|nr:unnamed protein product [Danaus chrysippus]